MNVINADVLLVLGLAGIVISAFPLLNGFVRGEMPRSWAVLCIGGFALVTVVMSANPNSYSLAQIPQVVARVVRASL